MLNKLALIVALTAGLPGPVLWAQQADREAPTAAGSKGSAETEADVAPEDKRPAAKEKTDTAPADFKPTEEVMADTILTLPSDI